MTYAPVDGSLRQICSVSTLPPGTVVAPGEDAGMTAHVLCSPDGRFVYGSNRDVGNAGDSTIAVYAVDEKTGDLSCVMPAPVPVPQKF